MYILEIKRKTVINLEVEEIFKVPVSEDEANNLTRVESDLRDAIISIGTNKLNELSDNNEEYYKFPNSMIPIDIKILDKSNMGTKPLKLEGDVQNIEEVDTSNLHEVQKEEKLEDVEKKEEPEVKIDSSAVSVSQGETGISESVTQQVQQDLEGFGDSSFQ